MEVALGGNCVTNGNVLRGRPSPADLVTRTDPLGPERCLSGRLPSPPAVKSTSITRAHWPGELYEEKLS